MCTLSIFTIQGVCMSIRESVFDLLLRPGRAIFHSCFRSIIPALITAAAGLGTAAYNWYQQKKQQNYDRGLQERIFSREDNAIQRQVADAETAGFNKFSVMGNNGAGAGAIVSQTPPQMDEQAGGKILDALNASAQLAYNKASAEKAKAEAEIAENNKDLSDQSKLLYNAQVASDMVKILRQNGLNANFGATAGKDGQAEFKPMLRLGNSGWTSHEGGYYSTDFESTPLGQEFKNFYANNQAQADINETMADYKDLQVISGIVGNILNGGSNAINAGANLKRAFKGKK